MIEIDGRIEIHAADACDLRCRSCSHFASSNLDAVISPEEIDRQMKPWSKRLRPRTVEILGGEPTINPRLSEILLIARRHWPDAQIRLTTNGSFLDRHPDLPETLLTTKAQLRITKHNISPEYERRWKDVEAILDRFRSQKIKFHVYAPDKNWTRRYHGSGPSVAPFDDGDQRTSWTNCVCRLCHQLRDGLLWKCPILAYLPALKRRWPEIANRWTLGLAYQPLRPDASDDEIRAWFALEDEPQCSLCPAHPQKISQNPDEGDST